MENQFSSLGWPEATIYEMSFIDNKLQFKMHDLCSYTDPVKYEVVEIEISEVEALRIEIIPYLNDAYGVPEVAVDFGVIQSEFLGFEGILLTNPFSNSQAEYYWVSGDFKASEPMIRRTGTFVYKSRSQ